MKLWTCQQGDNREVLHIYYRLLKRLEHNHEFVLLSIRVVLFILRQMTLVTWLSK